MKQIVIKYHNGKDVKSITRELNSELDVVRAITAIRKYVEQKMQNIISAGYPYQEMEYGIFKGIISSHFQLIWTKNYIEFTEEERTIQITFLEDEQVKVLPILAA